MLRSTLSPSHKKVKTVRTLPEPSFLSVLIPWYFLITLPTEHPAHCYQYQPQDYHCCMIIFSLHNPSILPPDHLLSTQPQHTATRSSSLYTTPAYCHQIIFSLHNPNILPPDHLLSTQPQHTATRSSLYTTLTYCHQIIFFLDTPITLPPDHLLSRLHYPNILPICKQVLGHMVPRWPQFYKLQCHFIWSHKGYMSICL